MTLDIVFLERETLPAEVVIRPPAFDHRWTNYGRTTTAEVVERARDADILVVNKVPVRRETIEQLPRLKVIAVAATGTNNIDLAFCRKCRIPVANIVGYAGSTVPEHTFALILALRRSLIAYTEDVRRGLLAAGGPILFLRPSDQRAQRQPPRHRRRGFDRSGSRRHRQGVRDDGDVRRPQGQDRAWPALYPVGTRCWRPRT